MASPPSIRHQFYLSWSLADLIVFANIAMVMLDITIIITTGVMMREFPQDGYVCVCVCEG